MSESYPNVRKMQEAFAAVRESANAAPGAQHIQQPYTIGEIEQKIASHDYNAELLLQHAMILLRAAPGAPQQEASGKRVGYVAPKGRYVPPVLFNPYTGEPRDARDIHTDPNGALIVPPGANLVASRAAATAPAGGVMDAIVDYLEARDALDNRESSGINGELWDVLRRRVHVARIDLDAALTTAARAARFEAAFSDKGMPATIKHDLWQACKPKQTNDPEGELRWQLSCFADKLIEATAARAAEPLNEDQMRVLRFLWGVGELDGFGFGDQPLTEKGRYWWRRHLRAAFPSINDPFAASPTPPTGTSKEGGEHGA